MPRNLGGHVQSARRLARFGWTAIAIFQALGIPVKDVRRILATPPKAKREAKREAKETPHARGRQQALVIPRRRCRPPRPRAGDGGGGPRAGR